MDMKHKGFTLIEVLIVIAVIAVLASIAIVSYRSVRENGFDLQLKLRAMLLLWRRLEESASPDLVRLMRRMVYKLWYRII